MAQRNRGVRPHVSLAGERLVGYASRWGSDHKSASDNARVDVLLVEDLLVAVVMIAGAASGGWAVGQRLRVKTIIVGATLTAAVLGVAFLVVLSKSRPHDANIGAGFLFIALAALVIGTPLAVISSRRRRPER